MPFLTNRMSIRLFSQAPIASVCGESYHFEVQVQKKALLDANCTTTRSTRAGTYRSSKHCPITGATQARKVTYLMRKPRLSTSDSQSTAGFAGVQQDPNTVPVRPLIQLFDMYHNQEASLKHNKVYALLGMRSEVSDFSDLVPDYTIPWGKLYSQVLRKLKTPEMKIATWDDSEVAAFLTRVTFLGEVVGGTHTEQEYFRRVRMVSKHIKIFRREGILDLIARNSSDRKGNLAR
ncbi:hypothetical protein M011DRAFT_461307 [Sporormia fimetaria CBS 119925]|uniref:Uncharacterized protein n=1 Tax=Sporormia fimetaria CBS 119925 TaxID=1340428 RepID=A0A6A6V294_9PLEO|nr:hypothetical protein M011DRAFT_461307 [Sporormia fimetaria CBS 119925]